ncbi:MAG TPA: zinc ABC transporter substrate-binding protein [Pseudolysinimonas sp.]
MKPFVAVIPIAVLLLAGCAAGTASPNPSTGKIDVVASTNVWGSLASTVGGDDVSVTSFIDDPSKDPHEYEANGQNQLAISRAAVVIENGGGYDDFVDTMLKASPSKAAVVLNAVKISGLSAPGGDLNEHVWYDFPTVTKVIDKMEAAFSRARPAEESVFTANADKLKNSIAGLQAKESALKAQYSGVGVSITEPVPLYMLNAIGLDNKTPAAFSKAIEDDSDASPEVLQQAIDLYSSHSVKLLAYNEQTTGAQTEAVLSAAKNNGIAVVPVTETLPSGRTYLSWMSGNLDAITAALAG